MSISFAATPQAKEGQQTRAYTQDVSAGAPPSRRTGYDRPYVNRDHWNKVFTQPEYFDSIAKQKGMVEGAKVSLHGDDYVYRQAMMGYLSATRNVPLDDMRSVFDAEKDGFAQKVLGKKTATARELFDWHKTKFERENEKSDAARTIIEDVTRNSLQDAMLGGDTPFVESVTQSIAATGDMFTEEEKSRLWEKAEEQDKQIRATQAAIAPEARFLFSALGQTTGQQAGMGAPDMREVAGKFAQLPDNQRKAIYKLAGSFAQLQKTDKGFWYQLAESLGRGTTAFTERIPRNFREQTLRGQLRLLESEQPVFRATGVAGAEFSAAGNEPVFGATQGQMVTPEEREQAKSKIQSDLGVLKVERELRDLAERVIDPIKTVTFLPQIVEEGLYGAAQSIPYTVAAAIPYVGMPAVASALFSANYDSIMLQYDGIDPDKAALIAAISAPIEAGLERMKVNTLMGRTPIVAALFKRLQHPNQRNLTRILIGSGAIVAEQNVQEVLQNATFPLVQTIAAALDQDMPDYDWAERMKGMPRELAVQFVALLPLSLMGIGALSHREMTRGADYIRNKSNLERMGYGEDQIDRITGAATADEAQTILQDEHGKRDPEAVKVAAKRVLDEVLALREQKAPASLPRLEKQGADYVVLSPEGKELARSTDQTVAEQALVSAHRETVQREMRDVHTGINEAVEFIQKVNEARQRGEDVAEVIREQSPRTLLTDYEANPTQENLDRLYETVRAFGQEINEPAELANFPVTGSNQGALAEGIWKSVIRINEGADGTIVMREFAQDNLKRAISEGRTTMDFVRQQLNDVLPQIDSNRIKRQLRTETDTDVIEAFSDVAVAYFRGSIREEQIPAGLRGIMRRLAIISRDIFRRAYNLARLRAEGKLDRDFEALLAEAVGVNQQALVDRSRERTEQEVGAQQNYSIGLREPSATSFNETTLPDGNVRFIAYHGSEQVLSQLDDRPIYVSSMDDGAGYGDATRMVIEGRFLPVDQIEAFAAKYGIAMEDLFHEEASMEQDLQEALRSEGYDGAIYYDQRRDDGDVMPAAVIVNPKAITIPESDDQTEAGTLAPDTDLTQLDPDQQQGEDWQDIPWEQTEKNYSIGPAVLPEAYPVLDQDLYEQIIAETQTTAAIHIDRMRVGKYEGTDLQGGMYFPAIVDNLKQGVVWAFNSKGVATAVAERARANGGYVKLVLMLEGNVIGNKTFANIWFKQLRKNIKAGKLTEADALAEMNSIRERYVTQSVKGETKKFTGHDQAWTSLKEAKSAMLAMPQIKRGSSYFQKTSTVTKRDGEKISYQSLLSQAMTAKGFPDATKIVEAIEEPAFKGLPKGTIVGLIKIDPDAVPMTAAEAGVPEHLSYGFVLKGKPVARMAKFKTLDALFPQIAGKLMSQQATDFPAQQVLNYSIGSRAQPDVERNVITLPDVTISGPANYSIQAWHASPYKYDKVSLSKAGTGEGAAVYGWGFYMAENPAVSGDGGAYQLQFQQEFDTGRRPRITINGKKVNASNLAEFIDDISDQTYNTLVEYFMAQRSQDFVRYTDRVKSGNWEAAFKEGVTLNEPQIYRVEADVESDELLDWDNPVPDSVAKKIYDLTEGRVSPAPVQMGEDGQPKFVKGKRLTGSEVYKLVGVSLDGRTPVQVAIQGSEDQRKIASEALLSVGIKGIRYLDQGSRGTPTISKSGSKFVVFLQSDQGTPFDTREEAEAFAAENQTYNYVIFDDSLIKILTRNGEQISVEQAAQEVSNYSISTQREIDRVQAAMDRLARSPSERISQYAALKERLAAALERNQPIMQSMRGDTLPQDFDRTRILNDLGFLDYILKVLPPEVRGRVGGYTNLAAIAPVDVYKGDQKVSEAKNPAGAIISAWMREGQNIGQAQKNTALPDGYSTVANTTDERRDKTVANFLIDRLKKIDRELERYLKRDLMERIFDVLDKSRPKAGQSGVKRSTLGPETQKFADMVYRSSLLDDEKTAERLTAIEAQITGIQPRDSSPEAFAESQKRISELSEEWTIVNTFGDLKSRPSETLAYGLEWLQGQLKAGRSAWQIKEAARIQENRERAAKVVAFLGKPTDVGRFENKSTLQRFLQAVNAYDLDHKSFEQFAPYLFGDEVAAELSKKMMRAQINEAKMELENTRLILAALREGAKAAGTTRGRALALFKDNQPKAVRKLQGRKVRPVEISIELAKKIVRGLADRSSLSQADVQTLADELAALPRDTRKENVTIQQVIFRGEEVRLTMSRAQAMQLWLTWQQTDAQEKMRADGFTDDSFDDLDNLISDPFSQAILRVTQRIYGSGYPLTNPVYARMFGMNMPMVKNYAPARYQSNKDVKDVGLDGSPLTAGGQPSFAKSRVNHTAKLAPEDALTVLQSHIAMQSHFVAFAEVTREYRSLLSNPDVREAIRQRLGKDVLRSAEMWGDQMEQRGGNKGREIAWIQNMLGAVIGGQSVSLLGYNLKSLLMQTDNFMRFFLALDSRQIGSALSDPVALMQNVRKVWKTDIIQTRLEGGATAETRFFFERFVSMFRRGAKVAEMSMMPMNYLDSAGLSVSGAIVYQAAYKDALDSGVDPTSAEQVAKDAVEAMVYRYGQPVLMGQKSNIENSGNAFTKAFFLFMSDPRLKMAIISDSVRGLATGTGDRKAHVRRIVAIEMMAVVAHVLATAFRNATSDDDDEDLWSMGGFARALLLAPFQGYFLVGSVSDLVLTRLTEAKWFTPTQNPLIRTADTAMRALNNIDDAFNFDDPDALVKEWTDITRSLAVAPPLAAPAVILNLVRPLVQAWERMGDDE